MSSGKHRVNYYRKSIQLAVFGLLAYMVIRAFFDPNYLPDFEAYCPFGGLQALTSFFVTNTLACSMTENQIFMGVVLLIGVFLMSKLFCGYICPIGTFTEWLGAIGRKFKVQYTIRGKSDRLLRVLKYALLFLTFYFTVRGSELFCKEYDPFYAIFTWFGRDVNILYAIIALVITIGGSIFLRQFWCKYLCPLGAITNIFTFAPMFLGVLLVYLILLFLGFEISWLWPLGIVSVLGFLLETTRMKGWFAPPFKISRNPDTCIDCKLCDVRCPMGIEVSTADPVTHIDCHLCGDCIESCPVPEVLQINKKERKWLPAAATILLIAVALFLASTIELPTINIRWGKENELAKAQIYEQSGLKSVKCFGSASSFASKMRRVPGVLGVEAYVQSHTVKVYYNPDKTDAEKVKKSIFTPTKTFLNKVPPEIDSLTVVEMGIDKLFDSYDNFYFVQLLKQIPGVYGLKTIFGEPVRAFIYYDSAKANPEIIRQKIESEELRYTSRGKEHTVEIEFGVDYIKKINGRVAKSRFVKEMFTKYDQAFNKYRSYPKDSVEIYRLPMLQAANPRYYSYLKYLSAHLSMNDNIIRFRTKYLDKPVAEIFFVKDKINGEDIYKRLTADTLEFMYRGGKKGMKKNVFKFPEKGKVIHLK